MSEPLVAAVVLTVTVDVPEPPETEAGLKEHVGAGVTAGVMLLQARLTAAVKPCAGVMVIVEVAVAPGATEAGDSAVAEMTKSGGVAVTVRPIVVSWLNEEVPVTVTLEVPGGVIAVVLRVRVEVTGAAPGVTVVGMNEQLASAGRPSVHARLTIVVKPSKPFTEMV